MAKKKVDEVGMAAGMGFQMPIGDAEEALRSYVRGKVREIVRKKKGGGGYVLYSPNQGKKRPPKAVGEFPTRAQAKQAELMRFPPKDPKKLKKARATVQKMKKRKKHEGVTLDELRLMIFEAAAEVLDTEEPEDTAEPAPAEPTEPPGDAADLDAEEPADPEMDAGDDMGGEPEPTTAEPPERDESRWEQLLSSLSKDALKRDSRLRSLHQKIENQSVKALEKAVRQLSKDVGGKVTAGKTGKDKLGRPYITCTISTKDYEVGPIYLYTKAELLNVVSDGKVKSAIMKLDPKDAKDVKQALAALPGKFENEKIQDAILQRDAYLQSLEDEIDDFMSDLDALELSIMKRLTADKYSGEEPIE